jgi:hypothetical protein
MRKTLNSPSVIIAEKFEQNAADVLDGLTEREKVAGNGVEEGESDVAAYLKVTFIEFSKHLPLHSS